MIEKPLKFGHMHIAKTAGSALNNSIYTALGLHKAHITRLYPGKTAENKPHQIPRKGMAFKLARNTFFLSGHISYSDLKELNRDFIFTVLRDPRARLVSLFTYAKTKINREQFRKRNKDFVLEHQHIEFYDYLERHQANLMSLKLFQDIKGVSEALENITSTDQLSKGFIDLLSEGLRRIDVIYACPIQMILDDLHSRGFIPPSKEMQTNTSSPDIYFGNLGSREQFMDKINSMVWLDMYVYQLAKELFPETVIFDLPSDDDFLDNLESRYNLSFKVS